MNAYCHDRDLLSIEPVLFLGGGFASQELAAGKAAELAGTIFTAAGADFQAARIETGMILTAHTGIPAEGRVWEIISVDSPATLTVSVLRANATADLVAPAPAGGLSYRIRTYAPQIAAVSAAMGEKLRQMAESQAVATADFADSTQLRLAAAYGVLADVFVARAADGEADDANWIKAEHYRRLHRGLQLQLRLVADVDGDGAAERTRALGNVTLRRS